MPPDVIHSHEFKINGHTVLVYYDSKKHQWLFSIDYMTKDIRFSRAKGQAVIDFLTDLFQ